MYWGRNVYNWCLDGVQVISVKPAADCGPDMTHNILQDMLLTSTDIRLVFLLLLFFGHFCCLEKGRIYTVESNA